MFKPFIILLFISLGHFSSVSSQEKNEILKINYDLFYLNVDYGEENSLFYDQKNNRSFFVFNRAFSIDSTATDSKRVFSSVNVSDSIGNIYLRKFNKEELIFREPFLNEKIVKDEWINIDWELSKNQKTINGVVCSGATGEFRGTTYIAWYAEGIPAPIGPWKLFGLPGAILEAYDTEKEVFYAIFNDVAYVDKKSYSLDDKASYLTQEESYLTIEEYAQEIETFKQELIDNFKKALSRMPREFKVGEIKTNIKEIEHF